VITNNSLSATDVNVKEYFDVSSYRNVLDMLNTFEGVLNNWGKDLHNEGTRFYFAAIYDLPTDNTEYYTGVRVAISRNRAIVGYAVSKIGNKGIYNTPGEFIQKVMNKNGLNKPPLPGARSLSPNLWSLKKEIVKRLYKNTGFSIRDLLLLSRNLNWELNRLRLPIPANFRQINSKIQGKDYSMVRDFNTDRRGINMPATKAFVNLAELMPVYTQLKLAVNALRIATRKEIDAANLAAKVREDTLRQEQAAIISREQAKKEAEQKRIEIMMQKKAALEKELADAQKLKEELAQTKADLRAELEQLQRVKQVATEPELVEINAKEKDVIQTIDKVESVIADKEKAVDTAKQAATNLNVQIESVVKEAKQLRAENDVLPPKKKTSLTPILLTIIGGALLT